MNTNLFNFASVDRMKLRKSFYKFFFVHTGFLIFTALPGIFINTFFIRLTNDTNIVLLYNLLTFACCAVSMHFSAFVMKKHNAKVVAVTGIIIYILLYTLLLILRDGAANLFFVLAILNGLANGFYWLSYASLLTEYSNSDNREKALSVIQISASVVNIIVPLVSAFLIDKAAYIAHWFTKLPSGITPELFGYILVFFLAFFFSVITMYLTWRLPKIPKKTSKLVLRETWNAVLKNKGVLLGMFGETFKGIREGAFNFILGVILFQLVQSEKTVGLSTFLASCFGVLGSVVNSRLPKNIRRPRIMFLSMSLLSIFGLLFVFNINAVFVVILSAANTILYIFFTVPSYGILINYLQGVKELQGNNCEIHAIKELFLSSGRVIGVCVIFVVNMFYPGDLFPQAIVLFGITLLQFLPIAISKHLEKATVL